MKYKYNRHLKYKYSIQRGNVYLFSSFFSSSLPCLPPSSSLSQPVRVLTEGTLVAGDKRLEIEVHHVVFNR